MPRYIQPLIHTQSAIEPPYTLLLQTQNTTLKLQTHRSGLNGHLQISHTQSSQKTDLLHYFPQPRENMHKTLYMLIKACEVQKQKTSGCILMGVWIWPAVAWSWSSLWPGEQSTEILMNALQTGLEVSTNRMKLMERACQESRGFNALSPTITTIVSHTHTHTHTHACAARTRAHTQTLPQVWLRGINTHLPAWQPQKFGRGSIFWRAILFTQRNVTLFAFGQIGHTCATTLRFLQCPIKSTRLTRRNGEHLHFSARRRIYKRAKDLLFHKTFWKIDEVIQSNLVFFGPHRRSRHDHGVSFSRPFFMVTTESGGGPGERLISCASVLALFLLRPSRSDEAHANFRA